MTPASPPTVARSQLAILSIVCGVAVSTIYAVQPVLERVGQDLRVPTEGLGWLVAVGQIGYVVGLVLLVPLGDVVDRRTLLTSLLLLCGIGCGITSTATRGAVAMLGLATAGMFAVVVQVAVAHAAAISTPHDRGRNIGAVTSGVVVGILGVRVLAGCWVTR